MSLIKQIKRSYAHESPQRVQVITIKINGKEFYGTSTLHPDDEDMYSPKIGASIAHMRAQINALKYFRDEAKAEMKILKKVYSDAYQNKQDDLSQDNPLRTAMWQAENRYYKYQKETNKARKALRDYLSAQDRAFTSLRNSRASGEIFGQK